MNSASQNNCPNTMGRFGESCLAVHTLISCARLSICCCILSFAGRGGLLCCTELFRVVQVFRLWLKTRHHLLQNSEDSQTCEPLHTQHSICCSSLVDQGTLLLLAIIMRLELRDSQTVDHFLQACSECESCMPYSPVPVILYRSCYGLICVSSAPEI